MQSVSSNAVNNAIFDTYGKRWGNVNKGVVGTTYGATSSKIGDFLDNEINGMQTDGNYGVGGVQGGSIYLNGNNNSLGVPDGWYNYLYIPHRTGFDSDTNGDNRLYGLLLLFDMTFTSSGRMYMIHRVGGANSTAIVK